MTPWIAFSLALAASDGISIGSSAIEFEPNADPALCVITQRRRLRKRDRVRLARAVDRAGQFTRPRHARRRVRSIRSIRREGRGCEAFVRIVVRGDREKARVTVVARSKEEERFARVDRFRVSLPRLKRGHFERAWRRIWARFTPAPPATPAPPPPLARDEPTKRPQKRAAYVDADLAREQAVAAAPPPTEPTRPPIATVALEVGYFNRSVSGAPGAAQSAASVPLLGARATLHGAPWLGLSERHALELTGGYWRRFVSGERAGAAVSVTADRVNLHARYRYALGDVLPRLGPLIGYELFRFESDAPDVLSTRFSVLRLGLDVAQPILRRGSGAALEFVANSALRWSPTGDASLGVDVEGGLSARLGFGLVAQLLGRFTRQSGDAAETTFVDETFEALLALGWSI